MLDLRVKKKNKLLAAALVWFIDMQCLFRNDEQLCFINKVKYKF